MKINYTATATVTPVKIFGDISDERAKKIGQIVKAQKDLRIFTYRRQDDGLTVFIEGNIGNRLDSLFIKLSGVNEPEKYGDEAPFYLTLNEAKKIVSNLSDEDAEKVLNGYHRQYIDLDEQLNDIWQ